ncbi:MAG: Nramp family divalent metal transporter, partial [Fidelibacterota bacterium]
GWVHHLGKGPTLYFAFYLLFWSFIVGGALIAACGLAGHALVDAVSVPWWGVIHSLAAMLLVMLGRYALFERLMKVFIAAMFVVMLYAAIAVKPDLPALAKGLVIPVVPAGSATFILGVMGGVGGSVTLLSYGYWMREKRWVNTTDHPTIRIDLAAAYLLTGLFGVAVIIIAAGVNPQQVTGPRMVIEVGRVLGELIGPVGKWTFLIGFWAAVFSSMLGVWQGVPYIFADFVAAWRAVNGSPSRTSAAVSSPLYRGYLLYLAIPPMLLLLVDRPVWIVIGYAVAGALFMPFLAGTLLIMNNRRDWITDLRNGRLTNLLLWVALALFVYLGVVEIIRLL